MSEPQTSLALPIIALILRLLTLILLLASLIIIVTDSATFKPIFSTQDITFRLKYIYSYRYMVATTAIALVHTFLQLPFAIYHVSRGKRLVQNAGIFYFDFFSDKVILSLLATGVGAGFGVTYDLKKTLDDIDDILRIMGSNILAEIRPELDNFFNIGFVSVTILLLGFLCLLASSIISSLALSKKTQN